MTPEVASSIAKARRLLREADIVLGQGLNEAAGRTAYLAAYHVAQAVIIRDRGVGVKTHSGVQTEFLRLTRDDPRVDRELRRFLSQAYNLKAIADYETGDSSDITTERATASIATARRFVDHFAALVSSDD